MARMVYSHSNLEGQMTVGFVPGDTIPSLTGLVTFAVGNYLYGRDGYALGLLAVSVASGLALIGVIRKLWA
jgi:hypothetical protein